MQHNVLWMASLSNGETLYENKGDYQRLEGEPSPWLRLLSYVADRDLSITSLGLYTNDGRRWHAPTAGHTPRFIEFADNPKPVDFDFHRKAARDTNPKNGQQGEWVDVHAVVTFTYEGGQSYQLWVDDRRLTTWAVVT